MPNEPKSPLKKFAIPIIAGLVVLVCLIVYGLRLSTVSDLETEISAARDEVDTMQMNLKNLNNLEEQLAQITEQADEVRARAINPADTAVNTAYFYSFETDDLKIESVEQRGPGSKNAGPWKMKNFGTTTFSIRSIGTYQDVMDLAYRIRGGEMISRIVNVSLGPADGSGEKKRRISMTIETLSK